jgi:succinate dehydrogenase / fumarate reductase flavoprotein subunit
MWNYCGIWRLQSELEGARAKLDELTVRADQCNLLDAGNWANQAVPYTRTLKHMIEMSKAIVGGAIARDESRGAHFKLDTPERDDDKWLCTTKATWNQSGPTFDFSEKVDVRALSPRPRKYKINQNTVARFILGDDVLPKKKEASTPGD